MRCPWANEHSDGRGQGQDSSTVLLPPTSGRGLGAFVCSHAHCAGRSAVDVVQVLPTRAVAVATEALPRALGHLVQRLASSHPAQQGTDQ